MAVHPKQPIAALCRAIGKEPESDDQTFETARLLQETRAFKRAVSVPDHVREADHKHLLCTSSLAPARGPAEHPIPCHAARQPTLQRLGRVVNDCQLPDSMEGYISRPLEGDSRATFGKPVKLLSRSVRLWTLQSLQ
eukprot:CAMPEP_0113700288 /NCGR_PEP_ID=MMETSP0038_2-20120614/23865_1 /TAXON_ID=2898 /ORGANISM="Cryptomonas paramecium" /LENGTH=136 /DNA_ID=CAMNT_0000623911 /DNA_START=267 /DNA_END=674 /DNA_ORIENTATION=- /assembly_acc=CAM_ASM_000170